VGQGLRQCFWELTNSFDQYCLYILVTSILMLSPASSVILVISNRVKLGTKHAMIGALGNVIAFQILVVLGALGLVVILTASNYFFYFKNHWRCLLVIFRPKIMVFIDR
jgi:hypothetical protein